MKLVIYKMQILATKIWNEIPEEQMTPFVNLTVGLGSLKIVQLNVLHQYLP